MNNHSSRYPIQHFVDYSRANPTHKALLTSITSIPKTNSFKPAIKNKNWMEAMEKEIVALEENKTWNVVDLPYENNCIANKWVYKLKFKSWWNFGKI